MISTLKTVYVYVVYFIICIYCRMSKEIEKVDRFMMSGQKMTVIAIIQYVIKIITL